MYVGTLFDKSTNVTLNKKLIFLCVWENEPTLNFAISLVLKNELMINDLLWVCDFSNKFEANNLC